MFLFGARADVDEGVLEQRSENEDHAGGVPDVEGLRVRYTHRITDRRGELGRHRQNRRDAESNSRRLGVFVDPEGYPREHDDQYRRDVRLKDKEADLSLEKEARFKTREISCNQHNNKLDHGVSRMCLGNVVRFIVKMSFDV